MLILLQWIFNLIIIISPIFSFFPQIIKVIYNKSDIGFNTTRVSLNYSSVFLEILLNISNNNNNKITYNNQLSFLNHNSRLISLSIDWLGLILKIFVKTKYSANKKLQILQNKILFLFSTFTFGIFLPIILAFNLVWVTTLLSVLSSITNLISYYPQIKETINIKESGSLSYLSVIFDYIGSIGVMIYLSTKDNVYLLTLLPVIISNLSIMSLLIIMIYFDYGDIIKRKYYKYKNLENDSINELDEIV